MRRLRKSAKTPLGVRKAQQILRHRSSGVARKRALATLRRFNRARRGQKPKVVAVNVGVLGVPTGRSIRQLPTRHFVKRAKKVGWAKVSKALTNLRRWNKNKNPKLVRWAEKMQNKVRHIVGQSKCGSKRHKKSHGARG